MDSTSVYGLELLVLEGTGGKALATDHREYIFAYVQRVLTSAEVLFFPRKLHHCFWGSKHDFIYRRQRIPWLTPDVIPSLAH